MAKSSSNIKKSVILSRSTGKSSAVSRRGFALIVALSLMAFVLLLLLSMTSLLRVETLSMQANLERVQAEQNALLGLREAMGALQLALGPDQRVSAAANLLETTVEQRPQVLGVWATADAPDLDQSEGDLIAWLVSDAQASEEMPTVNGLINLVSAGGIQSDGTEMRDAVWVAKTPVLTEQGGAHDGHYAWWIGDEGLKARVNLQRTSATGLNAKQRAVLELGSISMSDAAVLDGLGAVDFERDGPRILSLADLGLLGGISSEPAKPYFHALSTHSLGLLVDAKHGGLKQDLSLAFEMSDAHFNASAFAAGGAQTLDAPGFGAVQPVFWVPIEGVDGAAHGPVWHLLRDYYRLYHQMETPMTNPTIDARVFGPNLNHGDSRLQSPSSLSASSWSFDQQPAALFAGGKAKFYNQAEHWSSPFKESAVPRDEDAGAAAGIPEASVALDMAMVSSDPIRLDRVGDPLRGGGQSSGATKMPVMVTGNYLPYMQRYMMEIGFWFQRWPVPIQTNDYGKPGIKQDRQDRYQNPVAVHQVNRQRFVLHNPYNVRLRHNEMALDSAGCETAVQISANNATSAMHLILGEQSAATYKRPKQYSSYRQARVPSGVFAPGELKTFNCALHSNSGSSTVAYASEGIDPTWTTTFASNQNPISCFFEAPMSADPMKLPFSLYLSADSIGIFDQVQDSWQSAGDAYSATSFTFLTHLKQAGNDAFQGDAIKDRWPLASLIDTGLLLPGAKYTMQGRDPTVFTRGIPSMTSNFFPNGGDHSVKLTAGLIDTHSTKQNPYILGTIDLQLKATEYDRTQTRYPAFSRTNPLAPVRDNKNLLPADDLIGNSLGYPVLSPDLNVTFSDDGTGGLTSGLDYWGPSDGSLSDTAAGLTNPVLLELPTSPVLSLGKLQHANISVHAHMPALAIGNSLASPYINPEQRAAVLNNRYSKPRVFYDLSYLMNEALWDRYFFSSYSRPYDAIQDAYGTNVAESFDDWLGNARPLPNTRMRLHTASAEGATQVRAKLFDASSGAILDDSYQRAAENLMVAGAFNVNSTSVDAWRAVLAGARDCAIAQSGVVGLTQPSDGTTPFSRLSQPVSGESDGTDSALPTTWSGFRALNATEIDASAAAIVSELKARSAVKGHPYLSLADFVNRELSTDAAGRSGLLQAAIDKSGINDGLKSAYDAVTVASLSNPDNGSFPFPANIQDADGQASSANQAAPAYLMQADILQAIGSFIAVRSDTFRIRSYGASYDPISGELLSEVWLEAIVQRIAVPVDPVADTRPDEAQYWAPTDAEGHLSRYGRQFKLVSLRQLASDEI